jgi:hypothetical protein
MVDSRRWITALAGLALFAGVAAAQTGGSGQTQLTCGTNVSVTPTLRAEGFTEQTGDITLTCTGGSALAPGTQIPTVNVTIFLNTAVTSRLYSTTTHASEALLLIDEPGSGIAAPVPGFGPQAAQTLCPNPLGTATTGTLTACTEFANVVAGSGGPTTVAVNTAGSTTPGFNVFQGVVAGNSVTFFGIPVLAPVTSGISRVYRFTNIRANATTLSGGSAAGATPVIASISISGSTSLLIQNPTPTIGFVQQGLTTSTSGSTSLSQCTSATKAGVNLLTFSENFGTAFKTRVSPVAGGSGVGAGQGTNPTGQNIPGQIFNSESNFIFPVGSGLTPAGLADFGTRLKATFNNLPTNIHLFVSVNNVTNGVTPVVLPSAPGIGDAEVTSFASLVSSETVGDTTGGTGAGSFFPGVTATDNGPGTTGTIPVVEIPNINGTATAVWEVLNTNPSAQEKFNFAVFTTFTSNVAQNSPTATIATVNMSFAPTPPAFTSTTAATATGGPIPRFIADPGAAKNIFAITICRTILLYPFITNQAGFDTGIAIANTSTDVFGTGPQAGACALNWFGGTTPPAPTNSGTIASGTVYTALASTAVPNFQGYMIAVCNFQYAHGFAFISDLGARNLAMGYLALIIPDPANNGGSRAASDSGLSTAGSGEGIAQ